MERDREMLLSEFAGNAELKYELSEIMKRGTLPHAIIIEGAEGTGKRTLADIIAQYCVCMAESEKPCGICNSCMKAEKHIHPDIFYADGNDKALTVDSVRNMRTDAYIKPNEAPIVFSVFPSSIEETVKIAEKRFPNKDISEIEHIAEMCDGNIIFKALRRSDYIGKLIKLKNLTYDKINSLCFLPGMQINRR